MVLSCLFLSVDDSELSVVVCTGSGEPGRFKYILQGGVTVCAIPQQHEQKRHSTQCEIFGDIARYSRHHKCLLLEASFSINTASIAFVLSGCRQL